MFVKRSYDNLVREAYTQAHISDMAQSGALTLNVPVVSDVFDDAVSTYIVMDDIPFPSFSAWIAEEHLSEEERSIRYTIAIEKITNAVRLLLNCPLPNDGGIGPVGGGYIQHIFFGMEKAAEPFVNSRALQNFVNKVRFNCFAAIRFLRLVCCNRH